MERNQPKVIIADDHAFVADVCKKLLEPDYDVVATVGDGRALVRVAATLKPQVVILDIGMPLLNGLDAGQQVKGLLHSVKLIYLTMHEDADLAAEAFRRGASGYVLKSCAASELTTALRKVLTGLVYLSPAISKDTVGFLLRRGQAFIEEQDRLTERQREVLQLLAEGMSMKEIANVLNVATRTVAFHKYRIMEVLNTHSSAELMRYAIRNHLITS
jgi:DNA-binding NarL/FixJ family response regulator